MSQHVNSVELPRTRPLAPPELHRPQRPLHRQVHLRGRPASKPTIIRGITYYKAKDPEDENDIEDQRELGSTGPLEAMPPGWPSVTPQIPAVSPPCSRWALGQSPDTPGLAESEAGKGQLPQLSPRPGPPSALCLFPAEAGWPESLVPRPLPSHPSRAQPRLRLPGRCPNHFAHF